MPDLLPPVIVVTALGVLAMTVSIPLLDLCFWGDDTYLIKVASSHNISELLFHSPGRKISQSNYMPLLAASFRADWLLFGLCFVGYNLHSLLWLWIAGCSAYFLLREAAVERAGAFLGGAVLILAPATVSVSGLYSNRHYLFGLAFALLSLATLLRWNRGGSRSMFGLSLVFYLLAVLSKEPYAPLFLAAPFLVFGNRRRFRAAFIGYGAVFGVYFILRWVALHRLLGGYSESYNPVTMLAYLVKSLPRMAETLVWGGGLPGSVSVAAVTVGGLLVLATAALAWKRAGWLGVLAFLAVVALSLCVVAFALWVPIVRYADDPFYCHGDRLIIALSSSVWLSFVYLVFAGVADASPAVKTGVKIAAFAALPVIFFLGGWRKAQSWRMTKVTISQAEFVERNADQQLLVIARPPCFLNGFVEVLARERGSVAISTLWGPEGADALGGAAISGAYLFLPGGDIVRAEDVTQMQEWVKEYRSEFARMFPYHGERIRRPGGSEAGPKGEPATVLPEHP